MSKKSKPKKKPIKELSEIPSEAKPVDEAPARLRQAEIPGTERPKIKELEEAAELYVNLRVKMQDAVKKFKEEGKTPLIQLLHKHADKLSRNGDGEMTYAYDDMLVILKSAGEQLRVKQVDSESEIEVGEAPEDRSEG
jgi:hypothetical protein